MNTIATLFGDVIPTKICSKCKEEKPLSKFSSRTRDRNGNPTELRNDCQDCQSARGKEVSSLKKLHTQPKNDTYQCPLCNRTKKDLSYTKWKDPFVLDHSHTTGKFRGWICQDCNTAIARAHDDVNTLRNMIGYLEASI